MIGVSHFSRCTKSDLMISSVEGVCGMAGITVSALSACLCRIDTSRSSPKATLCNIQRLFDVLSVEGTIVLV